MQPRLSAWWPRFLTMKMQGLVTSPRTSQVPYFSVCCWALGALGMVAPLNMWSLYFLVLAHFRESSMEDDSFARTHPILWGAKENGYRQLWSLDQLCQASRWSCFGMNDSIFNIQLTSAFGGILFINSTMLKSSFLLKKDGGGDKIFLWKFARPLHCDQELGPEPQPSLREHKVRHLNVRGAQSRETAGEWGGGLQFLIEFSWTWWWVFYSFGTGLPVFRLHLWLVRFNGF